jgi:phage regulator Rha-like protein
MGIEENKNTVKRYIEEILNDLDYSRAGELLSDDFFGESGLIKGIKSNKKNFEEQRKGIPDIHN